MSENKSSLGRTMQSIMDAQAREDKKAKQKGREPFVFEISKPSKSERKLEALKQKSRQDSSAHLILHYCLTGQISYQQYTRWLLANDDAMPELSAVGTYSAEWEQLKSAYLPSIKSPAMSNNPHHTPGQIAAGYAAYNAYCSVVRSTWDNKSLPYWSQQQVPLSADQSDVKVLTDLIRNGWIEAALAGKPKQLLADYPIETIARLCHEANRSLCISQGDFSQASWDAAPQWQRDSAMKGVDFILANPNAPASASHESWLKEKAETGWVYGPVKDENIKQHPCCVPYEQLPKHQQTKDHLFGATVRAMCTAVY